MNIFQLIRAIRTALAPDLHYQHRRQKERAEELSQRWREACDQISRLSVELADERDHLTGFREIVRGIFDQRDALEKKLTAERDEARAAFATLSQQVSEGHPGPWSALDSGAHGWACIKCLSSFIGQPCGRGGDCRPAHYDNGHPLVDMLWRMAQATDFAIALGTQAFRDAEECRRVLREAHGALFSARSWLLAGNTCNDCIKVRVCGDEYEHEADCGVLETVGVAAQAIARIDAAMSGIAAEPTGESEATRVLRNVREMISIVAERDRARTGKTGFGTTIYFSPADIAEIDAALKAGG
jgi:hypothetical protein